jgi:putative ABC transport system permease protein
MQFIDIDDSFFPTYNIEIIQGRNFSAAMETDVRDAVIINETAAQRLGLENPLGKGIKTPGSGPDGKEVDVVKRVIGVVKDFHAQSLHQKIEPLILSFAPTATRIISLRLSTKNTSGVMANIKSKWNQLLPNQSFHYTFLDETFDRLYKADERINTIFTSFAVIAILISCLGSFGLAAYMTERRTKEVGIRKVMGASVPGILFLLSKEFTKWVLIANVIAWPLAYYFMNKWLQTFAYRVEISVWIFLLSGCIALFIALFTVGYQAIKAARSNPIKSLRYE